MLAGTGLCGELADVGGVKGGTVPRCLTRAGLVTILFARIADASIV